MGGSRRGASAVELEAPIRFLVVIVVFVAVLGTIGGAYATSLAADLNAGFNAIAANRIVGGVHELSGVGTGQIVVEPGFKLAVSWDGERLTLHPTQKASAKIRVVLPPQFTYRIDDFTSKQVCIQKHGMTVSIAPSCGTPTCQQGRCAVAENPDGSPRYGYYCENNVYTDEGFFQHYYTSDKPGCGGRDGAFREINRLVCPDRVEKGALAGCAIRATFRCESGGSWTVGLGREQMTTRTGECSGAVQHVRVSTDITTEETGERRYRGFVETPSGRVTEATLVTVGEG